MSDTGAASDPKRALLFGVGGLLSALISIVLLLMVAYLTNKPPITQFNDISLDTVLQVPAAGLTFALFLFIAYSDLISVGRRLLLIIISTGSYFAAVQTSYFALMFSTTKDDGSFKLTLLFAIAGFLGGLVGSAILFGLGGLLAPPFRKNWKPLVVTGAIMGIFLFISGPCVPGSKENGILHIFAFITLWQTVVAAALGYLTEPGKDS